MYDTRQEPNEFVGESLEDARAKAAEFFGAAESDLKVAVAREGEIHGAAGRTVIVAVPANVSTRPARRDSGRSRGDNDRPRRDRDEGRGESRGRGGRRGGPRERNERGDRGERGSRAESAAPASVADSKGVAKGDIGAIGEFLLGAVERMKLGSFEISESSEGDFLIYQLTGPAAEALQSGDGRAAGALQLVANQVSMRQSEDAPRIVVDVEGGSDERESTMNRLADRAVKRARETGRSVALDPMNGRDRRAIHLAVRDEDGVATMSIGEGRYRQVVVVPEGAPEYDEAVAESSRS